ncbi:15764_t:CDS:2 [Dentiscutata erythropus]|uniref:15764_t:CDS:1 n=1 Tax=Dentiscutata erythropus TaxID=1348616 RepID=A0A9N9F8B6_9GLOM|nr:15764_t:CDS:2 [Dentiscutata erythropus]
MLSQLLLHFRLIITFIITLVNSHYYITIFLAHIQQTTFDVSGSSNKINTELPETQPNKVQKISQIEEDSVTKRTESEELSSQTSYNMGSPLHFSSQEQNKDHQVIAVDQSLKVPDVKILTNHVSKLNKPKLAARLLVGIAILTTHLGEHLNSVHRIFSYQQYGKNSDRQTIIDSDKLMPNIPSIFSKMEAHKPLLKSALKDTEWPLLEDEDSESEPEDLTESLEQPTISQLQKKNNLSIVEPIHDVKTRWNSTFLVLKRLLQLQDAVEQLTRSLYHHPDFQQRKDRQTLSEKTQNR